MKLNLYLPDEIGERAKAAEPELNLSGLLRAAVETELDRRERMSKMLDGAREYELPLEGGGEDGDSPYLGVFTGEQLADEVYLTTDQRLLLYDGNRESVEIYAVDAFDDLDLRKLFPDDREYIAVCAALGKRARVEI